MLEALLAVGIGGGLGAILRTSLSDFVTKQSTCVYIKGAFLVNIIACFIAGILLPIALSGPYYYAIIVGFLGGFSTLSRVNLDAIAILNSKDRRKALCYLAFSYGTAMVFCVMGFMVSTLVINY